VIGCTGLTMASQKVERLATALHLLTYLLTYLLTHLLTYLLTYLLTPWSRVPDS